jgi:hypothetical protein
LDDIFLTFLSQAKGSEPLKQYKWKALGIKTVFEKQVKGNVFEVEGDRCQLQLPADDKELMHLTMGILVVQGLFNSSLSLTLRVRDIKGDQRRIHLSTSVSDDCRRLGYLMSHCTLCICI